MSKKLLIRKIHRYVTLIVGLQLLLWSVGGFYFTLFPIKEIHGTHLKQASQSYDWSVLNSTESIKSLNEVVQSAKIDDSLINSIELKPINGRLFYEIVHSSNHNIWVDAISMQVAQRKSSIEIEQIARSLVKGAGEPVSVSWITEAEKDSEYREKPLPVYKVVFDGKDNLHLYLNGHTGEIMSMRTSKWRIFDFMWMLHVMDYETRDNFNHLLLQFFAALAVLTSLTGVILWTLTFKRRKRWN